MKIALTGSYGLIGSALRAVLKRQGHWVQQLVRRAPLNSMEARWDPGSNKPVPELDGVEAVIHLAGENIAGGRWTDDRKRRIRDSRVESTRNLAAALGALPHKPKTFLCASAIGWYGDRGDEVVSEESPRGTGFLADVCRDWEAAARTAMDHDIRVACLRFGVVLSPLGGALHRMLLPFRLGLGGRLGSGLQYMSWIDVGDAVAAILFLLQHPEADGPFNLTSPCPVTNADFTTTLGRQLKRPTALNVPAGALRWLLGEMADSLLLSGARVKPQRLMELGFSFAFPRLEDSLARLLNPAPPPAAPIPPPAAG